MLGVLIREERQEPVVSRADWKNGAKKPERSSGSGLHVVFETSSAS